MRVLVTGATGFIGGRLVRCLAEHGHEPVCAGRSEAALRRRCPGRAIAIIDFARMPEAADWAPHLAGIDAVVNAVGLIRETRRDRFDAVHDAAPRTLFEACLAAGVRRVVQLSALGADERAVTRYHRSKRAADAHLAALDPAGARLDWCVLRPSLVYGKGGGSTELFAALAALPVLPRIGDGEQRVQPIHVDDLAEAIVRLLERPAPLPRILDAGGPTALRFTDMLAAYRTWLGERPAAAATLPLGLVRAAASLGDWTGVGPVDRETLTMLLAGNVCDPGPMIAATGVRPVPLAEGLAREPATAAERAFARLAFVRAPLRWSLALLWIWTALVSFGLYPREGSYALLAEVGATGWPAALLLYGAAGWDLALGLALAMRWRPRVVGVLMIATVAAFTSIITLFLPAFWLHPFAPVAKNVPLVAALLAMMAMEE